MRHRLVAAGLGEAEGGAAARRVVTHLPKVSEMDSEPGGWRGGRV